MLEIYMYHLSLSGLANLSKFAFSKEIHSKNRLLNTKRTPKFHLRISM